MNFRTISSVAVVALALSGVAQADETAPAVLAGSCAACHGIDGRSPTTSNMPALAGKTAQQLSVSLKAFKTDQVPVSIMNRLAKGYTDAEIDALAAYYANLR